MSSSSANEQTPSSQGGQELEPEQRRRSLAVRMAEVIRYFGPFGFLAIGGPAANIVQLRKIFVVQHKWVDERTFVDLFALGNALPGPAFSQLAFAISLLRGGILPALLSFVLLTGPGALAMLGIGFAVSSLPPALPPIVYALFSGLNSAAVGLIAHSAYTLSGKVITDPLTRLIVLASGAVASCYESQWLYPVIMVAGGSLTLAWDRSMGVRRRVGRQWKDIKGRKGGRRGGEDSDAGGVELETRVESAPAAAPVAAPSSPDDKDASPASSSRDNPLDNVPSLPLASASNETPTIMTTSPSHAQAQDGEHEDGLHQSLYFTLGVKGGLILCASFVAFFVAVVVARATVTPTRALDFFTNVLMAGTFIFGGGPVVIPLLRGYTVDPGWVLARDFLIGLALIQALPGPVFNFAVFLGVLALPSQPLIGAVLALLGIFSPGLILKVGTLPFYLKWRTSRVTRSVLRGLNAAAVGLIFAAIYRLFRVGVISSSHADPSVPAIYRSLDSDGFWVSIVAATFVGVEWFGVPAPAGIAGGLVGGLAWYGVTSH